MSVLEYIILAFALSVSVMLTLRACALKNPVRLTRGLGIALLVAVVHALLILAGLYVGNLLRFGLPEYDSLIYLGLLVAVALRLFFPAFRKKEKELPAYDISRWLTVLLLGIATGTNTFFVGLGLGFLVPFHPDALRAAIPLAVVLFLMGYLGIMLGRTKKSVRARRWQLIAVLFLLVFAIKGAFFFN